MNFLENFETGAYYTGKWLQYVSEGGPMVGCNPVSTLYTGTASCAAAISLAAANHVGVTYETLKSALKGTADERASLIMIGWFGRRITQA